MSSHRSDTPVLRLVAERRLTDLLATEFDTHRLEASGVLVKGKHLFVVFDNLARVARIDLRLSGHDGAAWLGEQIDRRGFEDIAYNRTERRFYLLIEASRIGGSHQGAVVECDDRFRKIRQGWLEFTFDSKNKGFEGVTWLRHRENGYLLALCEGNKCKAGKAGRRPGGGRIQIFRKGDVWRHVDTIKLPKSVAFEDYSALDVRGRRVAIVSQASSKIWVGSFEPDTLHFVDDGVVYSFPEDSKGRTVYCNVEGIAWLGSHQVAVVSDRATGKAHKSCRDKSQSVHIFKIV